MDACTCDCGCGTSIRTTDAHVRFRDTLGAVMMRFGIGRERYRTAPGLYALGAPGKASPVFVTANYKLSFDTLRKNIAGLDAWILVLDTKGINVWCAAGKGTFGTEELVSRIKVVKLASRISHRKLILPQLGAVGVAAHEVQKRSGFSVIYGPVRASDIGAFIKNGMKATDAMRRVAFSLSERVVLIPMEIRLSLPISLIAIAAAAAICLISPSGFALKRYLHDVIMASVVSAAALIGGSILVPLLLPVLPRAFSLKGAIAAIPAVAVSFLLVHDPLAAAALSLYAISASTFFALNFTGASTYTSLTGVQKEMRIALPAVIGGGAVSIVSLVLSRFFGGAV
ncbi:MAG: mercury methylation corrinoid protein HgcA [Spirochaetota bacterium]